MSDKCVEMSEKDREMRDRLVELLEKVENDSLYNRIDRKANYLIEKGVLVAPMPMADWLREELTEHINKRCFEEL